MKDVILVTPILITIGTIVLSFADDGWRRSSDSPSTLAFLAFLFALLALWNRDKRRTEEQLATLQLGYKPAKLNRNRSTLSAIGFMGLGLPLCLFAMAWMFSKPPHHSDDRFWVPVTLLSMMSLLFATSLFFKLTSTRNAHDPSKRMSLKRTDHSRKPFHDPDSLDVVGRRGSNNGTPS